MVLQILLGRGDIFDADGRGVREFDEAIHQREVHRARVTQVDKRVERASARRVGKLSLRAASKSSRSVALAKEIDGVMETCVDRAFASARHPWSTTNARAAKSGRTGAITPSVSDRIVRGGFPTADDAPSATGPRAFNERNEARKGSQMEHSWSNHAEHECLSIGCERYHYADPNGPGDGHHQRGSKFSVSIREI